MVQAKAMSRSLDRIVIINDRSLALGGSASLSLLSARLFLERGIPVTYISGDEGADSPLATDVEMIGLGWRQLLDRPLLNRGATGLYNRAAEDMVSAFIHARDTPGTAYHLHSWHQILSPAVFRALRPVEDRLVISTHDFSLVCPNGGYQNYQRGEVCGLTPLSGPCLATHCDKRSYADKAWRVARMLILRQMMEMRRTRALIATIHPAMHSWLARGGIEPSRLRAVRNPVTPFLDQRVEAEKNSDLFFIGRVESEKGVDLALEAARLAGRRMRVIGDGAMCPPLKAKFPDSVWEGWRTHSDIARLIGAARALIMPSRLPEPFGLVALEAMQCGVPLVAFGDAFVAREAAELGAALIAAEKTAVSLGAALGLLKSDAAVRQLSECAYARAGALSHTPQGWRDALIALYQEQIAKPGAEA